MTDPNWASPSDQSEPPAAPAGPPVPEGMPDMRPPVPGAPTPGYGPVASAPPPGSGPDDATPMYYAMPDPNQNWGLNPNSGVRYEVLVPRPPRPMTVTVGLMLTYVGVGVALVYLVINSISEWTTRDQVAADAARAQASGIDTSSLVGVVLVIAAVFWVLVASGLVICAIIANRGSNGARITLASLMGVLGVYQLCTAISAGALKAIASSDTPSGDQSATSPFAAFNASSANIHWWSYVGSSLLAVIALIVFVLLIIPPTNRYFSAGPGRRFAPGP